MNLNEFMTVDALAKQIGVSKHVVSRWARDLGLPIIKVGSKPIVHEASVCEWLKSRETRRPEGN